MKCVEHTSLYVSLFAGSKCGESLLIPTNIKFQTIVKFSFCFEYLVHANLSARLSSENTTLKREKNGKYQRQ